MNCSTKCKLVEKMCCSLKFVLKPMSGNFKRRIQTNTQTVET